MTEINDTHAEASQPKRMGRPLNPNRHKPDGTHDNYPLAGNAYFREYYRTHYVKPYTCGICGSSLQTCSKIKKHEQSRKCLAAKQKLETLSVLSSS